MGKRSLIIVISGILAITGAQPSLAVVGSSTSYVLQVEDFGNSALSGTSANYSVISVSGENIKAESASYNLCVGFTEEALGNCSPVTPIPPVPPTPPPPAGGVAGGRPSEYPSAEEEIPEEKPTQNAPPTEEILYPNLIVFPTEDFWEGQQALPQQTIEPETGATPPEPPATGLHPTATPEAMPSQETAPPEEETMTTLAEEEAAKPPTGKEAEGFIEKETTPPEPGTILQKPPCHLPPEPGTILQKPPCRLPPGSGIIPQKPIPEKQLQPPADAAAEIQTSTRTIPLPAYPYTSCHDHPRIAPESIFFLKYKISAELFAPCNYQPIKPLSPAAEETPYARTRGLKVDLMLAILTIIIIILLLTDAYFNIYGQDKKTHRKAIAAWYGKIRKKFKKKWKT